MPSVQQLAAQAYACFEVAERDADGSTYVRLLGAAPEWVGALVKAAHGTDPDGSPSFLPDDYRYAWTREACAFLADDAIGIDDIDIDECAFEWAQEGADVYTGQLLEWLASHAGRVSYADDGLELVGTAGGVLAIITAGQVLERQEVFGLVLAGLRERAEEVSV